MTTNILHNQNKAPWRLYFEGDDYYHSLLSDIRNAKKYICIDMYIFHKDEIGEMIIQYLMLKARLNVRIRLLIDGLGSRKLATLLSEKLNHPNIEFKVFRPFHIFNFFRAKSNQRNHRKLIVIDKDICYLGGMNFHRNHSRRLVGEQRWRDSMIRLQGLIAHDAQKAFNKFWDRVHKKNTDAQTRSKLFDVPPRKGRLPRDNFRQIREKWEQTKVEASESLQQTRLRFEHMREKNRLRHQDRKLRQKIHKEERKSARLNRRELRREKRAIGKQERKRRREQNKFFQLEKQIENQIRQKQAERKARKDEKERRKRKEKSHFKLISIGNGRERRTNKKIFMRHLRSAQESILLETAYFVPRLFILRRLKRRARRGVDVKVLISRETDVPMVWWAGRALYGSLLRSGVRIFEYQGRFLHAKSTIIDNKTAFMGSSNLDYRSSIHNLELDLIIHKAEVIGELNKQIERDLSYCQEIHLEDWEKRPLRYRVKEQFYYLFRYYL